MHYCLLIGSSSKTKPCQFCSVQLRRSVRALNKQPSRLWLVSLQPMSRAVAYLGGGHGAMAPPLARPWKFFRGDFIWKGAFLPFSSKNCKIQQCLMVFWVSKFQKNGCKSKKCFGFRGLRPPDPPTRGSTPGPRWGLCPQTPVIGSRSTRSPWLPLCQIRNTPLV